MLFACSTPRIVRRLWAEGHKIEQWPNGTLSGLLFFLLSGTIALGCNLGGKSMPASCQKPLSCSCWNFDLQALHLHCSSVMEPILIMPRGLSSNSIHQHIGVLWDLSYSHKSGIYCAEFLGQFTCLNLSPLPGIRRQTIWTLNDELRSHAQVPFCLLRVAP